MTIDRDREKEAGPEHLSGLRLTARIGLKNFSNVIAKAVYGVKP